MSCRPLHRQRARPKAVLSEHGPPPLAAHLAALWSFYASVITVGIWAASSTKTTFLNEGTVEGRWKNFLCQSSCNQSPLGSDAMQSAALLARRWCGESSLRASARRGRLLANAASRSPSMLTLTQSRALP